MCVIFNNLCYFYDNDTPQQLFTELNNRCEHLIESTYAPIEVHNFAFIQWTLLINAEYVNSEYFNYHNVLKHIFLFTGSKTDVVSFISHVKTII